jgi:hypothetical protein
MKNTFVVSCSVFTGHEKSTTQFVTADETVIGNVAPRMFETTVN